MEVRRACKRSQSSQLQLSSASSDRNISTEASASEVRCSAAAPVALGSDRVRVAQHPNLGVGWVA